MRQSFFYCFSLILGIFFVVAQANAAVFNPNYILDDEDLEDYESMSLTQIQNFILNKGGLGNYVTTDIDGQIQTAAAIIDRVAKNYRINPEFLLSLIQKEQGLVEDLNLEEARLAWATGYGVCDSCDKDHPEMQQYKGFANQIEQAAKRFRETYLDQIDAFGSTFTGWGPGITKVVDGRRITPVNRATATLYSYTPHISGNRLLWKIWQKWFKTRYPDGSLLQSDTDSRSVWLISGGKKRKILSLSTLYSRFNPDLIIKVSDEELEFYEEGIEIKFPDYSLLRAPEGNVFLIRGDKRYGIPSYQIFKQLGFKSDDVINASWDDINLYTEAEPITLSSAYPRGALLQNSASGGIYYVEDDVKHPIWSKEIMFKRFPGRRIILSSPDELEHFTLGEPIKFNDGELIGLNGQPDIFVISEGERRPIPSGVVFESMGWKWKNVTWTTEKAMQLHPLGSPIDLTQEGTSELDVPSGESQINQATINN